MRFTSVLFSIFHLHVVFQRRLLEFHFDLLESEVASLLAKFMAHCTPIMKTFLTAISPVIFPLIILPFISSSDFSWEMGCEKWFVGFCCDVRLGIMMLMSATRTPFFERYSCHNMATVRDPNPPQQTWHQV